MKISVDFDVRKFNTGLLLIRKGLPDVSMRGMRDAMDDFKDDCLYKLPACPIEEGDLRAAHEISVKRVGSEIVGELHVDLPYAVSIHEGISRWGTPYKYKTPGTGAKWIQSKQLRYRRKYFAKIKSRIIGLFKRWFS